VQDKVMFQNHMHHYMLHSYSLRRMQVSNPCSLSPVVCTTWNLWSTMV